MNRPLSVNWTLAPAQAAPTASSVTFGHAYNRANQRVGQTVTDNTWLNYPAATPGTTSYAANALNQYTAVGAVTPGYDGNGNLTSDGTFTLGYDAENRLVSASGAGNTASYTFDAQGRRKTRTVNGTTTVFVTGADNREVLEYDGSSGASLRWYAYGLGPNAVLNQMNVAAGTRMTLVPDMLGSIVGSLDSGATSLSKVGYLPYGKSGSAGPFGFTGQRIDLETAGLYYYRARHYSPARGRFLQTDPIGYLGGINVYAYVTNNPLNRVDPFGRAELASLGELNPTFYPSISRNSQTALSAALDLCAVGCDPAFWQSVGPAFGPAGKGVGGIASEAFAFARALANVGRVVEDVGPLAGGGARLENLSIQEITRIQNAANRTNTEISVVGSHASGSSHALSDWDYVVPESTSARTMHSLRSSLPEGPRGLGEARNQDLDRGLVRPNEPFITFTPQ